MAILVGLSTCSLPNFRVDTNRSIGITQTMLHNLESIVSGMQLCFDETEYINLYYETHEIRRIGEQSI